MDGHKYNIITLYIPYLYHTTMVYDSATEEEYEERRVDNSNYEVPELGSFPTDLKHRKWFTIVPLASYGSKLRDIKWAYLKYKTTKPLRLIDIRTVDHEFNKQVYQDIFSDNFASKYNADGYIGLEDYIEICLINPHESMSSAYQLLEYIPVANIYNSMEYADDVNKLSEKIIKKFSKKHSIKHQEKISNNLSYSKIYECANVHDCTYYEETICLLK